MNAPHQLDLHHTIVSSSSLATTLSDRAGLCPFYVRTMTMKMEVFSLLSLDDENDAGTSRDDENDADTFDDDDHEEELLSWVKRRRI